MCLSFFAATIERLELHRAKPRLRRLPTRMATPGQQDGASLRAVKFEHVLVVGAGQMGGGIARVVAGPGRRVSLYDAAPDPYS